MDQDNLYDKIQDILGNLHGNFNILEEQIDIEIQLEYFETSKNIKKLFDKKEALNNMESLFADTLSIEEKKSLLIKLASIDKVEAFRIIERYILSPDPLLKDWATLALQESRMLLESIFLDQNQIFISTGLGYAFFGESPGMHIYVGAFIVAVSTFLIGYGQNQEQ